MVFKKSVLLLLITAAACNTYQDKPNSRHQVREEVTAARDKFFQFAKAGQIDSMLSFHLNSGDYRLYENGKAYDYHVQSQGHQSMKDSVISSITFNMKVRDSIVFDHNNMLETWEGNTVALYTNGKKDTSPTSITTIIYRNTSTGWKFSYIHSSAHQK